MRLLLALSALPAAAGLTFQSVALVASDPKARFDPSAVGFAAASGAADAMVLVEANSTIYQSVGGKSWTKSKAKIPPLAAALSPTVAIGTGEIAAEGYLPKPLAGPFTTTSRTTLTVDPAAKTFNSTRSTAPDDQTTWAAPPHPVVLFSLGSGGITTLASGTIVATPWVWYSDTPLSGPRHEGTCCNGSVVAYVSHDKGKTFTFRSEIASKATVNAHWPSEEVPPAHPTPPGWAALLNTNPLAVPQGPNENDCTTLKDGKTILTVIRKDGGDGVPHHKHVPYFFATSKDEAATWTLREVSRHDIAGIWVVSFQRRQRYRYVTGAGGAALRPAAHGHPPRRGADHRWWAPRAEHVGAGGGRPRAAVDGRRYPDGAQQARGGPEPAVLPGVCQRHRGAGLGRVELLCAPDPNSQNSA